MMNIKKSLFHKLAIIPSSDCANQVTSSSSSPPSSSSLSTDQEMGSNTISINRNEDDEIVGLENHSTIWWFITRGRDLNPARMVLAEMLGTFILVLCVCGIVASTEMVRTGGQVGLLEYAVTGGLSIIVVIFSVGPISGAHVNPSITFAFAILGQFPWRRVPFYIVAQVLGSVLATYVGESVYGIEAEQVVSRPLHILHGQRKAFWAELIATFIVMFLAASMARKAHKVGQISGVVVGVAISLAVLITGPISGGSMNPARSLGPAIVSRKFNDIWLYILAPTVGAVVGALVFRALCIRCGRHSSPPSGGGLFSK